MEEKIDFEEWRKEIQVMDKMNIFIFLMGIILLLRYALTKDIQTVMIAFLCFVTSYVSMVQLNKEIKRYNKLLVEHLVKQGEQEVSS